MIIKNPSNKLHSITQCSQGRLCAGYIALLIVLVPNIAGCGLFGAFYGVFIDPLIPPPTIKAEHNMSQKRVLIWIDGMAAVDTTVQLKRELTVALAEHLTDHQAIGPTIDYGDIARFRYAHPDYAHMSVQQLGRSFEADEVFYMMIEDYQLHHETGEGYYRPHISGYLKIVDTQTGKRLWPTQLNHKTFDLTHDLSDDMTEHEKEKVVRRLCQIVAEQVCPNFYDHTKPKS